MAKIRANTKSIIGILGYTDYRDVEIVDIFESFTLTLPRLLNINYYDEYIIEESDTWPGISYKFYNTPKLWWVIAKYNQVIDPFTELGVGETISIIKPEIISSILLELRNL